MVSQNPASTQTEYTTVCDKIEYWAKLQPDHTAISFGDRKISYAELDNAASHIAWLLSQRNVGKGDKIPVLAQRTPEMVACFLGVLKSGALFVPIDTESWSQDRIEWTLRRVSARVILNTTKDEYPEYEEISHLTIESSFSPAEEVAAKRIEEQQIDCPWHRIDPSDLAYTIFTSGTTSTPKGVMVPHSCVLNYVEQGGSETPFNLNATPSDRIMLIFSPGFDACTGVIVSTLCNGAELQIATTSDFLHTVTLCTTMVCTPSVLNTIQDPGTCSRLKTLVLGGEAPPVSLVRKWAAALPTCAIYNFYGPTETTFACLVARIVPGKAITLGNPMSNSKALLLDGDEEADYGEICITGPGLAKGYFENEALTNEKFVYWRGERIYRTGDFARRTDDGLEFAGRKDSFVKNRGFLVNLESQVIPILYENPEVVAATAFMHRGRLVAFVTPAEVDTLALRTQLASQHDAFVVPDLIRALDYLPLTPNGKADNRGLQQLLDSETSNPDSMAPSDSIAPDAPVMDILMAAVSTSLQLPISDIDKGCSFQELGGNSLAGLKILSFLQSRGLRLRLIHLFDLPNLSSVCEAIENMGDRSTKSAISETDRTATLTSGPMTSVQTKMIQANARDSTVNYMLLRVTIPHTGMTLDSQKLKTSWYLVMQRHSIFRTAFSLEDGLQHISPELNLTWESEEATQGDLENLIERRSRGLRNMILQHKNGEGFVPVQACRLISVPNTASTLLVLAHHSQADGWSLSLILDELRSALDSKDLVDPPQYMDIAIAQNNLRDDAQGRLFWSEMLENHPEQPPLVLLTPSPDREDTGWSESLQLNLDIDPATIETAARLRHVTAATLVYCAWGLVLSNYTFTDNVSFGVVLSGRNIGTASADKVVGPLLNTCPFVLGLGNDETVDSVLSQAQTRLLHMMEYQWSADEALAKIPAGRISNIFQSIVVIEYDLPGTSRTCELLPEPWTIERKDKMEFGISLLLESEGDGLRARILFDGSMYAESSIRSLLAHFRSALHGLLQPRDNSLMSIRPGLISDEERLHLLNAPNQSVEYAGHPTLKDAFEATAYQYPDLRAIECVHDSMTYRQLDLAANKLANDLMSYANPKDVVGILTDGSLHWIVAILAVLKAGCICCPIDVKLPATRIQTIIEQSDARSFIAANRACASVVDNSHDNIVICDEFLSTCRDQVPPLSTVSKARDIAYLVFTSGTTGIPKGVPLHNQSILMAIDSEPVRLFTKPGRRNAQVYSLGFDVVTVEIFGTLCYGGTLVLKEPSNPLGHLSRVHAAYATPSLLAAFSPDELPNLDTVNLAGEPVPQSIADNWSHKRLHNGYGPCECGPISTIAKLHPGQKVTIGKAVPHLNVYLLDHHQCLVAPGVVGEIYLSGPQTTEGYWNSPDLTNEKFLPNPFSPGEFMYKTGDLGQWNHDMSLVYLGRVDNQVKVRGFRIELEEIDRALVKANPSIQQAATIIADPVRIVAFVTPRKIDTLDILSKLMDLLPAYTRPSQIIALDTLPQSANNKIDRKALQTIASEYKDQGEPPLTPTECLVAKVWGSVLGTQEGQRINRHDDFLGIGGNSLLSIRAARLIAESVGHRIPVSLLLRETVLSRLSTEIDKHAENPESQVQSFRSYVSNLDPRADITDLHALSELEEELHNWHITSKTKSLLNTTFRFELNGDLDTELLRNALVSVIQKSPILRARYTSRGGSVIRQIVDDVHPPLIFTGAAMDADRLQSLVNEPFDLAQDQLIRVIIWEQSDVLTSLILVTHHIVTDKHSIAILLKSISDHYNAEPSSAIRDHQKDKSPEPSYIEWAQWLRERQNRSRSSIDEERQAFWRKKIGVNNVTTPLRNGSTPGFDLDVYESVLIRHTDSMKVSQRMAVAATALTLGAVFGSNDITLGIPYANREEPGSANLMGVFLDRLPIRLSLNGTNVMSIDELLDHVANEINLAVENQVPYSEIVAATGSNKPLFDVMVVYHWQSDALENSLKLQGIEVSSAPIKARGAKFPLQLEFTEQENGLHCGFEFNSQVSPSYISAITSFLPVAVDGLLRQRPLAEIVSGFTPSESKPGRYF